MNIKPLGNKVLLKIDEPTEKVVGGIFLPENAKQSPNTAEVIAVGPGKVFKGQTIPMTVSIGDKVIYSKRDTYPVDVDEEGNYFIISEDDIFAIVE